MAANTAAVARVLDGFVTQVSALPSMVIAPICAAPMAQLSQVRPQRSACMFDALRSMTQSTPQTPSLIVAGPTVTFPAPAQGARGTLL